MNELIRRILPILLAIAMLFGISIAATAEDADPDPEAPSILVATANKKVPPRGITCNSNYGYGTVDSPWEQEEVGVEVRINPQGVLADEYAEENYKQFSLTSYYGDEIPITVGPGRTNSSYTFYKVNMTLADPGWYCLNVGKDFKNNVGKTIGDYTGGEDLTYWILKAFTRESNGTQFQNPMVDLTTNLQNINYEDTSAYNNHFEQGKVAMDYQDTTCPDYLVKLTAAEGYDLPATLSISVNGRELTPEKDYSYTPETLQTANGQIDNTLATGELEYNLKVDRHAINGPVVITASAVKSDEPQADPALVSSAGNELKARSNTTLTLENAPAGEGYTYKFIVYNTSTNSWYKLKDFGPETTFDWYTGPAGVKNLYVDIKDAENNVTRVALEGVNVAESDLTVKSFTISPEGTLSTKSQATLTAEAEKGEAPYEYKFIVYNETTQQWYKLKAFGPESTFDWYTGPAGSKKLYVDVKDATGKVVRESLSVTVE